MFEIVVTTLIANFVTPQTVKEFWKRIQNILKKEKTPEIYVDNVREFWRICRKYPSEIREGSIVTVKGTLSKFAPMVIGDPRKKREIHKEFRLKAKDENDIDPMLSLTSGNTVWRLKPFGNFYYLGLYQGIVRNSVPVFVSEDVYHRYEGLFFKSENPYCMEVELRGVLAKLPEFVVENFKVVSEPSYGIFIGYDDTHIKFEGDPNYMDGDIWITLKSLGKEKIVSRFLDIGDIEDLEYERELLKEDFEEIRKNLKDPKLIMEFDQVNRLTNERQVVDRCWTTWKNKI